MKRHAPSRIPPPQARRGPAKAAGAPAAGQTPAAAAAFTAAEAAMRGGDLVEAERIARAALAQAPHDLALTNLLGVVLKRRGCFDEALAVLKQALRLAPGHEMPAANIASLLLAAGQPERARDLLLDLTRRFPAQAGHARLLASAARRLGDADTAMRALQRALALDPSQPQTWADAAGWLREQERHDESLALLERGLKPTGGAPLLRLLLAQQLRLCGRVDEARALLDALAADTPDDPRVHVQQARLAELHDAEAGLAHLRRAAELAPRDLPTLAALADALQRTRGPREAANIDEAWQWTQKALALPADRGPHWRTLRAVLVRCADHAAADALAPFDALCRAFAAESSAAGLHLLMANVVTPRDRLTLLAAHRHWGRHQEALAARSPLRRAPPTAAASAGASETAATTTATGPALIARRSRGRIRVALVSSDLRDHPVSYFALPLIEAYDRSRFEVYGYSWSRLPADRVQQHIASRLDAFCVAPQLGAREAAQRIADDRCDLLLELGGSTHMNKLEAMAWRPAPVQASWLGYPHSSGLATIDRIVLDPWLVPPDARLLVERPLVLEDTWVSLGRFGFSPDEPIDPVLPEARLGRLTFGTMNNPFKYTARLIAAWAGVLRRVPDARFLFVRPEGAVAAFRDNLRRAFAAHGVAENRIDFTAVRGAHLKHYNAIDIALDTFPQTGGTTTCETLWMGVPLVSMYGPSMAERLSRSNLANAGLPELCTPDEAGYADLAVALAADRERRRELRATLRQRIARHPLGQPERFTRAFERAWLRMLDEGPHTAAAAAMPDTTATTPAAAPAATSRLAPSPRHPALPPQAEQGVPA